jgi:DNA-binding MarR family transcriptional regulator
MEGLNMAKSNFPPLLHLSYVLQQTADEMLDAETGVGLSAVRIMSVLDKTKPVSQRDVAVRLRQTESNVSRQLHNMKKAGLVNISRNKKDSRQRDVTLTTKGQSHYQKAEKLLKRQQAKFLKILNTGEAKLLDKAAQKIS